MALPLWVMGGFSMMRGDATLDVAEHGPAGVHVADDVDLAVAAGVEGDVSGAGGDVEVGLAADVERAFEAVVCGEGCSRHRQEKRSCEESKFHGVCLSE